MKERIQRQSNYFVLTCTFHSLGARILRESIHHLGFDQNFTIYDEEDVQKRIQELNLEDSIELTGVLPKSVWHEKSKDFDILINTTNFDNTPNSIIEGMALGLTIVSTNVGGMMYLVNDGEEGILVEKQNPGKMADAIIKIIKENNQELSVKARKKAESFGWNEVKHKWFNVLK